MPKRIDDLLHPKPPADEQLQHQLRNRVFDALRRESLENKQALSASDVTNRLFPQLSTGGMPEGLLQWLLWTAGVAASSVTVQTALDSLVAEGLVRTVNDSTGVAFYFVENH